MWKGGEKVDAEAEEEKDEVDDDDVDDDDGEAAEGWKGTDLTSQMQEGAGGGFFGFRESKKRGRNMGRPEEGKPIVWGCEWTPEFPRYFCACYAERRARVLYSLV